MPGGEQRRLGVQFQVGTEGWYSVSVDSSPPLDWACRRYNIQAEELAPTPTPTMTPTGTPPSATAVPEPRAPDAYEPNNDISQAVTTGVGLRTYLDAMLAEPFEAFRFSFGGAAVYP